MGDARTVEQVLDALERRDAAAFQGLLAPSVSWEVSAGEGGLAILSRPELGAFIERLRAFDDQRRVKELVATKGSIVVRTEGTITPPGAITYGGTGFSIYDCADGLIVRRRVCAYRKDVLDALGLSRADRQGLLVVRDDNDERLYHFMIDRGSQMTWARYADLGTSDHDHCELCWQSLCAVANGDRQEGYTTLDGAHWLCPDCFDEVRHHFALHER